MQAAAPSAISPAERAERAPERGPDDRPPEHQPPTKPARLPAGAKLVPQGALTVVAPIKRGHRDQVVAILDRMRHAARTEEDARIDLDRDDGIVVERDPDRFPFDLMPSVHFGRVVLLEKDTDATAGIPASLCLATDFDGDRTAHIQELVNAAEPQLRELFQHCEGYPEKTDKWPDDVCEFLRVHDLSADAYFSGVWGRTVRQIKCEGRLHRRLTAHLDEQQEPQARRARLRAPTRREMYAELRQAADRRGLSHEDPLALPRRVGHARWDRLAVLVLGPIAVILAVAKLIPFGGHGGWWSVGRVVAALVVCVTPVVLGLRYKEKRDPVYDRTADAKRFRRINEILADNEDEGVQNQMTILSDIKPGAFRYVLLTAVLWFADGVNRLVRYEGKLLGIETIHFARWVIIPRQRRLLFLSNYDGSWESYLGDFVDHAAHGLNAIWSNVNGYPRTRFLISGGARLEERFKASARIDQIETQVWYRAYPKYSLSTINANSRVRAGLETDLNDEELVQWLSHF